MLGDGRILSYVMRERHNRVKHALTLDMKTIDAALSAAGLRPDQIDAVAITSTQCIELIIDAPERFSVRAIDAVPPQTGRSSLAAAPGFQEHKSQSTPYSIPFVDP